MVPEGLTIIQVGDLVHKGPNSKGCVRAGRPIPRELTGPLDPAGRQPRGPVSRGNTGRSRPARGCSKRSQQVGRRRADSYCPDDRVDRAWPVLVTHSGMTMSKWRAIGQPVTAAEAAELLNGEFERDRVSALAAGRELDFGDEPGVVWADACVNCSPVGPTWRTSRSARSMGTRRHTSGPSTTGGPTYPGGSLGRPSPKTPRHDIQGLRGPRVTESSGSTRDMEQIGADVPLAPLMLTAA